MSTKIILTVKKSVGQVSKENRISPQLKKLIGSVKLPENFDERKEIQTYFENKHC